MEDTLREDAEVKNFDKAASLNPCFNGRYSQSLIKGSELGAYKSLNPCFNGRYSQRYTQAYSS